MTDHVPALVICALIGLGAWHDLATRTIPDMVSVGTALMGVFVRLSEGWHPALTSMLCAACLLICFLPLHARGLFGGGDVKLLAALALGWPPLAMVHLLLTVACCGSALAALYILLHRKVRRSTAFPPSARHAGILRRVVAVERRRIQRTSSLPYGLAIAVGVLFFVFTEARV